MKNGKIEKETRAGVTRRGTYVPVTLPPLPMYDGKPCIYLNHRLYIGNECVRVRRPG